MRPGASPHGQLLARLLPPVSYDATADLAAVSLEADGLTLDRVDAAAARALSGLRPFDDLAWLAAFEAEYALPGPCAVEHPALSARVAALAVALRERAGINREWYHNLAALHGYSVDILEYRPFVAGSRAGEPLYSAAWQYVWAVRVTGQISDSFTAGDCAGEYLQAWGDSLFECLFRAAAPAHTVVLFSYENQ